jgi:hypothetical protein
MAGNCQAGADIISSFAHDLQAQMYAIDITHFETLPIIGDA